MSHIEQAVTYSKKIEGLLADNYGAIGKGLHEKLSSVEGRLPSDVVRKIRYIASVRNKLVHTTAMCWTIWRGLRGALNTIPNCQ